MNGATWPDGRPTWRRRVQALWDSGQFAVAFCEGQTVVLRRGAPPGLACASFEAQLAQVAPAGRRSGLQSVRAEYPFLIPAPGPPQQTEVAMKRILRGIPWVSMAVLSLAVRPALADGPGGAQCQGLPSHGQSKAALSAAMLAETSGLNNHMWATIVNRDGIVCAVAFSGITAARSGRAAASSRPRRRHGHRLQPGQRARSSNGSGQPAGLALSTANLYSAVQPGGSLYGCSTATR